VHSSTFILSTEQTFLLRLRAAVEGDAQDAADLALRVMHGVEAEALLLPVDLAQLDAARLAEVDVAGQLAHDQDVQPGHDLRLQGRGIGQFRIQDRRAQVGKEPELLADAQQAALRPLLARIVVPLRTADGAEQHGIGRLRQLLGRVGIGLPVASTAQPPSRASSISILRSSALSTRTASAMISGPMPSPGRTQIFMGIL
jgi:hypothetical protein